MIFIQSQGSRIQLKGDDSQSQKQAFLSSRINISKHSLHLHFTTHMQLTFQQTHPLSNTCPSCCVSHLVQWQCSPCNNSPSQKSCHPYRFLLFPSFSYQLAVKSRDLILAHLSCPPWPSNWSPRTQSRSPPPHRLQRNRAEYTFENVAPLCIITPGGRQT